MTSRPAVQRSLSGNPAAQRPQQQHRALSQQYPSSAPISRKSDNFLEKSQDTSDSVAHVRYGTAQSRLGGSRLKLEITKDSKNALLRESSRPVPDAPLSWKPSAPVRGKPILHQVGSSTITSNLTLQDEGQDIVSLRPVPVPLPMPMPVRPGQHAAPTADIKSKETPQTAMKKEARPRPYTLEVPSAAPHYSPNGHADFFPWVGNHPEDQFSESVIRQGFFDKTQMTQNETGSAKASIFPALKHKSGLQTLSALFSNVLGQRRAYGQITSNSTFKPPPRVTVTDTKREIWLKDLANPTISLRRLSRSIPHGIRGKVLLDQSLGKSIPVERAVWLAKCVGANELRSFRRKGVSGTFAMGGEAKWIRDFTVCMEQFLEGVIASCGDEEFSRRVNYAIRLSTHFHAEHLLDREHYLDWLVTSLENSRPEKLPLWLLIIQIYWKDILVYRKYARRLSTAILSQFAEIFLQEDLDVLGPLVDRLQTLLRKLLIGHPESFVALKHWAKHRPVLARVVPMDDKPLNAAFTNIDQRNERLTMQEKQQDTPTRQQLIRQLDLHLWQPFTSDLPSRIWSRYEDKDLITRIVLEWGTSAYRPGSAKVFIAVRILRAWSKLGIALTEATLSFLESTADSLEHSKASVYNLISELVRSRHFSLSIYLQWLIARGGIYDKSEIRQDGACATRLLAELPTHNLSDAMIDLRNTLLQRAGFDITEEGFAFQLCTDAIQHQWLGPHSSTTAVGSGPSNDLLTQLSNLSRTTKSEIGLWLRERVRQALVKTVTHTSEEWLEDAMSSVSMFTVAELGMVRCYLETIDDFAMLADVLGLASTSTDPEVLGSVANSLNLHLETFAAIGALNGLFESLLSHLRSCAETQNYIPRILLSSLASLATRMPDYSLIAQELSQELARSDRQTAADACSPVSDHMAGLLQIEEADFADEIERILASGTSMDQSTLSRLFDRITSRLEQSWAKSNEQQRSCGLLLTRLRTFDAVQFDVIMAEWAGRVKQLSSFPSMAAVFGPLIGFGCLEFKTVLTQQDDAVTKDTSESARSRNALDELILVLLPLSLPGVMTTEDSYRFRMKQLQFQRSSPSALLHVISRALEYPSQSSVVLEGSAESLLMRNLDGRDALQKLVLIGPEEASNHLIVPICQHGSQGSISLVKKLTDSLLRPNVATIEDLEVDTVLGLANDFNLPFCQIKLASILYIDRLSSPTSDGKHSDRLEAFERSIKAAVRKRSSTWTNILPLLDDSIAQHLCSRAETQFLALVPALKTAAAYEMSKGADLLNQAKDLLFIITVAGHSGSTMGLSLAADIVVAFNGIWQLLTNSQCSHMRTHASLDWLPLLITFTTIHNGSFDASKVGQEYRAKVLLALAALLLEMDTLDVATEPLRRVREATFDLALLLVDSLPDDIRQQCIRSIRETKSSRQLRYLLSFTPNPSDWLILSQREKHNVGTPGPAGASSVAPGSGNKITDRERLVPYPLRRWEMLGVGSGLGCENDTSLSLTLFGARKS